MADLIRVFVGVDERQPLAYTVLQSSIQRHTKQRVLIEPLKVDCARHGLTSFTFSRFLVPMLCDYSGRAIFLDADIVVTGDIAELWATPDDGTCVQVMQEQPRFEWPSVMLFNCERCGVLTPDFVADEDINPLSLEWGSIGKIPPEWNFCVGYSVPREAKLYHFTQGIPVWWEVRGLPEDSIWDAEQKAAMGTVEWRDLMSSSVHAKPTLQRLMNRLRPRSS